MDMVRIAKVEDFLTVSRRTYKLLGRPVGVFKRPDGSFHAMEMACRHQGADLSGGSVRDGVITCPWHGWRYDLATGSCVWGSSASLRAHRCEIRGGDIYVSLRPAPEDQEPLET